MYVENRTKIPNFPTPRVFNAPAEGFPLEFCIGAGVSENLSDGAFRWSKKFSDRFSRLIQYRSVMDTQPATLP